MAAIGISDQSNQAIVLDHCYATDTTTQKTPLYDFIVNGYISSLVIEDTFVLHLYISYPLLRHKQVCDKSSIHKCSGKWCFNKWSMGISSVRMDKTVNYKRYFRNLQVSSLFSDCGYQRVA